MDYQLRELVNTQGAFWGLMVGLAIGMIRFGLEFGYTVPACGTGLIDSRPEIIKRLVGDIHYLHFGCILFVITIVVTVIVTLLTEPIDEDYVSQHHCQPENLFNIIFN